MYEFLKEELKMVLLIFLIILATHTVFFMVYGYCMSGDALLALRNFYYLTYNVRL